MDLICTSKKKNSCIIESEEDEESIKFDYGYYLDLLNNIRTYSELPIREVVDIPFKSKTICSYGIILYSTKGYWFLVRRRYSPEYLELIRGSYIHSDIKILLEGCSPEEIKKLLGILQDVDYIDKFIEEHKMVVPESDISLFNSIEKMKDSYTILLYELNNIQLDHNESEWLFPKGKQINYDESTFDASRREFEEESGLDITKIRLVSDTPIQESYIGRNRKKYQTICWVYITDDLYPKDINHRTYNVSYEESKEISIRGWFTYEECEHILRESKKEALIKSKQLIESISE